MGAGELKGARGIEAHGVLFALLMKYGRQYCGDFGWRAVFDGLVKYGEERGRRMAEQAKKSGEPLTIGACQIFGEWVPEYEGQMQAALKVEAGRLQTHVTKCAWSDAWEAHGLTEQGKYYCVAVDDALARGFSPELRCRSVSNLSWGAPVCILDWCTPFTEEELVALLEKKKQVGPAFAKSFDFHAGHLFHTVGGALKILGEAGQQAVDQAVRDFIGIFGQDRFQAIRRAYREGINDI